ncbi:MAG: hypothetical protein HYX68_12150 [Planctomycetes bacterium]|nr:hypothetical protein [Planctomycetota bacterium]
METYFLEYLLNGLDQSTRAKVDAYLADHSEARIRLALLRQALEPLAADAEPAPPPPLLVERTLARIAEHICTARPLEAPPVTHASLAPARSWWRRADALIAACLLLTVGGIGLMVLGKMRGPGSAAALTECKNNLRQFYVALQTYRDTHGQLPDVAKQSPRDVAGIVVPILQDAGTLPSGASVQCPGIGAPVSSRFTLTALRAMSDEEFQQNSPSLSMCYAYSLGFRDGAGHYHGPGGLPNESLSQIPIMADRPPPQGLVQNSANHDGKGQNVLFLDGHVRYLSQRTLGSGEDIFMNRANLVAAGLDPADFVLGYSAARP